jgi:hypothetical protein
MAKLIYILQFLIVTHQEICKDTCYTILLNRIKFVFTRFSTTPAPWLETTSIKTGCIYIKGSFPLLTTQCLLLKKTRFYKRKDLDIFIIS